MFKGLARFKENEFLFSELVKRDFKKKYQGTFLGMIWSVLSPLMMLLVMSLVFTSFFGRNTPHFRIGRDTLHLSFEYVRQAYRRKNPPCLGNARTNFAIPRN